MKLGIKREKIGDILVGKDGADILLCPDILKFVENHITTLTRFQKANIEEISIKSIRKVEIEKIEITITVASMRIDGIVSELLHCSRSKANEILMQERIFVNGVLICKSSKEVKVNDFITIRGKGKFQIIEQAGTTKKGNLLVKVQKWI
ncbi:MAG: YlmH/Sll1252 family protein [Clostridia bacterium]